MSTDPNADANAKTEKATKETQRILDVIASGNQLLLKSCREAFRALNVTSGAAVQNAAPIASANFALVPSAEDGSMIVGAPVKPATHDIAASTLDDRARQGGASVTRLHGGLGGSCCATTIRWRKPCSCRRCWFVASTLFAGR
ncbi:hypothetical protein PI124_g7679 [Phytophthora idaei]|nr:hypothetical protein PI126_g6938 [Phytophthora idaei]KAG3247620.1 hypothetical protein PI124_g7679 [Phytophthora idaei]